MARIVPIGYIALREAAQVIAQARFSGVPERAIVAKIRKSGEDVADGAAPADAISELWNAADAGKLRVLGIGGKPRRIVKLDPEDLKEVPFLRSPRGGDFNLLRPRHRLYSQITAWFGLDLMSITIAFREKEITKLARSVIRMRRESLKSDGTKKKVGRPGCQAEVSDIIREIVANRKWGSTESIKALTQLVNRQAGWAKSISEDTVGRALDGLFETTGDRLFQRPNKRQRSARR